MGSIASGLFSKPKVPDNSSLIDAQREQQIELEKQQAEKEKQTKNMQEQAMRDIAKRRRNKKGASLLQADTIETEADTLG